MGRTSALLSYANDLTLVTVGAGNRVARAPKVLDAVTRACKDLGFRISADKSRAMAVKTPTPEASLRIQGVRLEWCTEYPYLGVVIDRRLTFRKEVEHRREKKKKTLRHEKNDHHTGRSEEQSPEVILHTGIVDYAAVALVSLTDSAKTTLERIQNAALRQILGAPRWTKLEFLRAEPHLPPLMFRLEEREATWAARIVTRLSHTPTASSLLTALPQDNRLLTEKTWVRGITKATRNSLPNVDLMDRGADVEVEGYNIPPPWTPDADRIYIAPLRSNKRQCPQKSLLAHATETFATIATSNASIYYTDGHLTGTERECTRRGDAWMEDQRPLLHSADGAGSYPYGPPTCPELQ